MPDTPRGDHGPARNAVQLKETNFFAIGYRHKNIRYYMDTYFPPIYPSANTSWQLVTGEALPAYIYDPSVPEAAAHHFTQCAPDFAAARTGGSSVFARPAFCRAVRVSQQQ